MVVRRRLGQTARAFRRTTRRLRQLQRGRGGGGGDSSAEVQVVPATPTTAPAPAVPAGAAAVVVVVVVVVHGPIVGIMRRLGAGFGPDPLTTDFEDFANWFNLPRADDDDDDD